MKTFQSKYFLILSTIFYLVVFFIVLESCETQSTKESITTTKQNAVLDKYIGSSTCQSCHQEAYEDWEESDHYKAMLPANDSTILGDFENASYSKDGVDYKFFKKEGKFIVNTQGDDSAYHDYEVIYAFGHYPLQQYLIEFPKGKMQVTRASWDSRDNKWFHQYEGNEIHHKDWLHWTGNAQNWNTMCASCHSTDLKKNYNSNDDTYHTTWSEINVGCESCHGPGNKHVEFVNSESYEEGKKIENSGLLYAQDLNPKIQINTCLHCHARKAEITENKLNSDEIMDDLIPEIIRTEFYFADGQIDDEDYVYGSFVQSKMFHNGVTCSNCHNPHSGKIYMAANDLCMSCHEPKYNLESHHFHPKESKGAECVNCHMPAKTYMGNDHRRDHSFRVPRPDLSVKYGTPNSCNGCHEDKPASWASNKVKEWYGNERAYHFSDDLVPGSTMDNQSEPHLVKLLSDTLQPAIARATAAFYLRNFQNNNALQSLLVAIDDKEAIVRYHAIRSLQEFPPQYWVESTKDALSDKVRAVRIAAANLFHVLPADAIPQDAIAAYQAADAENRQYLEFATDFAVGNVMLADYKLKSQDQVGAIKSYIKGLEKDSLMNYARLNLSTAYSIGGDNQKALQTLKEAAAIDPSNDRIYYNLGLLYNEMKEIELMNNNFQKAVDLGSTNPRLYYNYGLSLMQNGKAQKAEQTLQKGLKISPYDESLNYAAAYFYLQNGDQGNAKKYVSVLKQINPNNPNYKQMFKDFGL